MTSRSAACAAEASVAAPSPRGLAAAVSPAPTWPQAAGSPGPQEGMAEQEASGLQVLLRTLQVGGGRGAQDLAGSVLAGPGLLGAVLPESPPVPVAWSANQQW